MYRKVIIWVASMNRKVLLSGFHALKGHNRGGFNAQKGPIKAGFHAQKGPIKC